MVSVQPADVARLCFIAEYFDPQLSAVRRFQLFRYGDQSVEMNDLKTRKKFLKRTPYPSLAEKDLYVGSTVNVFSRALRLVDYGDDATRSHFVANAAQFVIVIHGTGLYQAGSVVDAITSRQLRISSIRLVDLPSQTVSRLRLNSPRAYVVVLNGAEAAEKVTSIQNEFIDGVFVVTDEGDEKEIISTAFARGNTTAVARNCSLCVVKPHCVASGYSGKILQRLIDEGFEVSAVSLFTLSPADAEDFLEVYNGVVPEYKRLVEEFGSGPCWAIEVRAENAVNALRAVCGPHDPEVCHVLFPHTIRSKFGIDRVRNAVHCTDLEEDAPLESEFFFSLLLNRQ